MFVHMIGVTSGEENFDWIAKFGIRLAKHSLRKNIKWPSSFLGMDVILSINFLLNLVDRFGKNIRCQAPN